MSNKCKNELWLVGPQKIIEKINEEFKKGNLLNFINPEPDYPMVKRTGFTGNEYFEPENSCHYDWRFITGEQIARFALTN